MSIRTEVSTPTIWSYNQGVMVGVGVLAVPGDREQHVYLVAGAADGGRGRVADFGTGTTLVNQGPVFNAIYFRNPSLLDQVAPDAAYASEAQSFATAMWAQRQAGTGSSTPSTGSTGPLRWSRSTHCWPEFAHALALTLTEVAK